MELTREIARRFNSFYGETFPEPQALLTPTAKCPGLDGRKMSKSYNNGIFLSEDMGEIKKKIQGMLTEPSRLRKTDPGDPQKCNLFPYHELLSSSEEQEEIVHGCTHASMGCVQCKKLFVQNLEAFLVPLQDRGKKILGSPDAVWDILEAGNVKARQFSEKTIAEVRRKMGL